MMNRYLTSVIFFLTIINVYCQVDDERDLPPQRVIAPRIINPTFEKRFSQGRCPEQFFQLGNECVFFSNDGKIYAARQIQRVCAGRIARMVAQSASFNLNQPNMKPTLGVRQLVLNTPEKTELLRAIALNYQQESFAVHLPEDYNTLRRCNDNEDDKWPRYCTSTISQNATCFDTKSSGPNDICVREIDCAPHHVRLSCEFTLPGSPEIITSQFRNCPRIRDRRRGRLPIWAWVLIAVGAGVIILVILATILAMFRKSKAKGSSKNKKYPEPRIPDEKVIRITTTRPDAAREPMLIRSSPKPPEDAEYLQPRSSMERIPPPRPDSSSNA